MPVRYSPRNPKMDNPKGVVHQAFWDTSDFTTKLHRDKNGTNNQTFSNGKNVKKMCPKRKILSYTYPSLHEGKVWYIGFYAEDPATGRMRRKRYKVERIKGVKAKRRYAQRMIYQLMDMLDQGWNPWTPEETSITPPDFDEVCERYLGYVEARLKKNTLRPDSVRSYRSHLKMFREWCSGRKKPVTTCDQLTKALCVEFLDYVYIEKNASARVRNNYRIWMSSFFAWMVEHGILTEKPTDGIKALPKPNTKARDIIPEKELVRLKDYLKEKCPNYLLMVYLMYYCFIRPKELSMLRLRDINLKKGTITIPSEVSKNKKSGTVTLPIKVIHYMLDLGIFNSPSSYYLFSEGWKPGKTGRRSKAMYDWWVYHIVKDLHWPKEYQLYSLKDTGITRLLHHVDALTVRNQARHSDISITNIYAQRDNQAAEELRNLDDLL